MSNSMRYKVQFFNPDTGAGFIEGYARATYARKVADDYNKCFLKHNQGLQAQYLGVNGKSTLKRRTPPTPATGSAPTHVLTQTIHGVNPKVICTDLYSEQEAFDAFTNALSSVERGFVLTIELRDSAGRQIGCWRPNLAGF